MTDEVERIARALRDHPPGWQADHDFLPELRGPCNTGGDSHTYDGSCALCRAGDRPEALKVLVADVLRLAADRRLPCRYCNDTGTIRSTRAGITANVACSCPIGQRSAARPPGTYQAPEAPTTELTDADSVVELSWVLKLDTYSCWQLRDNRGVRWGWAVNTRGDLWTALVGDFGQADRIGQPAPTVADKVLLTVTSAAEARSKVEDAIAVHRRARRARRRTTP